MSHNIQCYHKQKHFHLDISGLNKKLIPLLKLFRPTTPSFSPPIFQSEYIKGKNPRDQTGSTWTQKQTYLFELAKNSLNTKVTTPHGS